MKSKITLELDAEDANLVQGILDNFANFRVYSSMNLFNRNAAQKVANKLNDQILRLGAEKQTEFSYADDDQAVS